MSHWGLQKMNKEGFNLNLHLLVFIYKIKLNDVS